MEQKSSVTFGDDEEKQDEKTDGGEGLVVDVDPAPVNVLREVEGTRGKLEVRVREERSD